MRGRRPLRYLAAWLGWLAAGGLAGVALRIGPGLGPGPVDRGVGRFVHAHRPGLPVLTAVARELTRVGDPSIATAVVASVGLGLVVARRWAAGLVVVAAAVGGNGLANALKRVFHRQRPELAMQLVLSSAPSFPSAHATLAGVAASLLSVAAMRSGLRAGPRAALVGVAWLWGLGVAASRVWLGVHYLTDVATGLLLGAGWAWSASRIGLRGEPAVAKGVGTCL